MRKFTFFQSYMFTCIPLTHLHANKPGKTTYARTRNDTIMWCRKCEHTTAYTQHYFVQLFLVICVYVLYRELLGNLVYDWLR